jgi:hypothetical protein
MSWRRSSSATWRPLVIVMCRSSHKKASSETASGRQARIIVSMIHKVDGIPEKINLRDNIFILVDEAHRTTGGDLGNYLMGALPNATYLGFTVHPLTRPPMGRAHSRFSDLKIQRATSTSTPSVNPLRTARRFRCITRWRRIISRLIGTHWSGNSSD